MKYSEEIVRRQALMPNGQPCEILERITHGREVREDGTLGEPVVTNRRFDLRTGERVNHLGGDAFELDVTGDRLRASR